MSRTQPPSYDAEFFRALEVGVEKSATSAAGLLVDIIRPNSVVDVGCGTGIWLAAFQARGVTDILGVDGPWVPEEQLAIPRDLFRPHDLTAPLALDRRFDLALCLETAEHLPPDAAPRLVESLTQLAPVVVFSAAVPEQGGSGHVNEQWPGYWAELFAKHGYRCSTVLRERLWRNDALEVWYRQNLLCFADEVHAKRLTALFGGRDDAAAEPLDIVHPELFVRARTELARHVAYAERLEGELRRAKTELRNIQSTLRSTENNLRKTRDELWRVRQALPYRVYRRLRSAAAAAKRATSRLLPHKSDRP